MKKIDTSKTILEKQIQNINKITPLEMIPDLPDKEMKTFHKYLDNCNTYFEFGSGGSTFQASKKDNIKCIYSVESDQFWIDKLYQYPVINQSKKVNILYIDIKALPNNYGYPGKDSTYNDWIKYSRAFISLNDSIKKSVDLILIDGRFRVACVLNLFDEIDKNTFILFDDFFNRGYYHIVLDYYTVIEKVGRMAVMKKKNILPPKKAIIYEYENDSR